MRAAFEHFGKKATDKALENAANKLRISDVPELYARLGSAELQPRDVINVIFPDFSTAKEPEIDQKLAVIGLAEDGHLIEDLAVNLYQVRELLA